MYVIAIHENGIKLYYRLFYDDGSIGFKLNREGMLIEDNINDMTQHEINIIQWAKEIIKAEEDKDIFL